MSKIISKIADHTKNIIELENISFAYGRQEEALTNITLQIHQGDFIGFIGPNGAGKTTLVKIIAGLLKPKQGTVKLFGQDINNFSDWHKIGYVPQKIANFDANFPITVFEAVLMGRYSRRNLFRNLTEADKKIAEDSLKQVDMWEYRSRLIGDLSGGQQQRVFIARALAGKPEIILLDEPTTGVDKKSQDDFFALLQKLNREMGLTLVLVLHDIERVMREVMHIACIDRTLTCHTSPEEYLKESQATKILGQEVKIMTHHHHTQ
jgi:zinc transport system ATP-binding protein